MVMSARRGDAGLPRHGGTLVQNPFMRRLLVFTLLGVACAHAPKPAAQNPSPMVDTTRAHERVMQRAVGGRRFTVSDVLPKPAEGLVTTAAESSDAADLVIHFLGPQWLVMQAADDLHLPVVVVSVNLGAGSSVYGRPFADAATFDRLVASIEAASGKHFVHRYLVGFSAGYGAIRAILRGHYDQIDGVLLLDGLHTSYIPENKPLAAGGKLDASGLDVFQRFAGDAIAGRKRLVITHSEIFPGTFASTTETTDWLLASVGLKRTPVVAWGPHGMQQLSEVHSGSFTLLGFAGNSAPDHLDHLHTVGHFLRLLLAP